MTIRRCHSSWKKAAEAVAVARPRPRGVPKNPHSAGLRRDILGGMAYKEFEDNPFNGRVLYRFFDTAEHADALTKGYVWITTLERCRQYENEYQGDPEEGYQIYNTGTVTGSGGEKDFDEIARREGISAPGRNCTLSNVRRIETMYDVFLVCTALRFAPAEFAATFKTDFCCEISDGGKFFLFVSQRIRGLFGSQLQALDMDKVTYREREYRGLEDTPGKIGFVKPKKYEGQAEVRMLWWVPGQEAHKPFPLYAPEVAPLCRRIP